MMPLMIAARSLQS